MALPKDTKVWLLFVDGRGYAGEATEVTPPKLVRKMEEFRGAGMDVPVKLDMGMEAMQGSFKIRGDSVELLKKWGAFNHDGVGIRLRRAVAGASGYTLPEAVEEVWRGRFSEIDQGSYRSGDANEKSYTFELSYYKYTSNGRTIIEIDAVNLVMVMDGIDLMVAMRNAAGL